MKNKTLMKVLSAFLAVAIVLCLAPLSGFVGLKFPEIKLPEWNLFDFNVLAEAKTYSGICGENITWSLDSETGVLDITGTGAIKDYTSSSKVPWISYRSTIKTVTISNDVTNIGDYMFYNCDNLSSVVIPDSVTRIGKEAFWGCTNLTSISLPVGITAMGDSIFYGCSNLTSISIPDSVTVIGDSAFRGCSKLESIKIPDSVTVIGDSAFRACSRLESVKISDSVISIGAYAFYYDSMLSSVVFGDSVVTIGDYAFNSCKQLSTVIIPDSVTDIGEYTFQNCSALSLLVIGNGLISIGDYVFSGCGKNMSVTIPATVKNIGYESFFSFSLNSIEEVYYLGTDEDWKNIRFNNRNYTLMEAPKHFLGKKEHIHKHKYEITVYPTCTESGTMTYTCLCGDSYTEIIPATGHALGEENNCCVTCGTYIADELVESTRKIVSSGTCGENISWVLYDDCNLFISGEGEMTNYARGCSPFRYDNYNIRNVIIEEGITSIGDFVFEYCEYITSVIIPRSVTKIGYSAFYGCYDLSDVQLPDGITEIDEQTFWSCDALTSISIPEGVTKIGDLAFYKTSLEYVEIPHGVTYIGSYTFGWCDSIRKVSFTNSVKEIGDNAFERSSINGNIAGVNYFYFYGSSEEFEQINIGDYNSDVSLYHHIMSPVDEVHSIVSTITKAPTCTETGTVEYTCSCGDSSVRTEILQPTGHSYITVVTKPTCNEGGYTTNTCISCGDSYVSDSTDALGHERGKVDEKTRIEPTCTEDGYTGDVCCPVCGEKLHDGDVIPATGHTWSEWEIVKNPECEVDGVEQRVCENGSPHSETRPVSPTGHIWNEGVIDPDSTCNECGTKTYTCLNNESHQYTEQVPLNPDNHKSQIEIKDEKAPTCTENGYTGDTYCTGCGEKLADGEVISAHGHDYQKINEKCQAPDYGVDGYDYYECSYDSSHNYKEKIPALVKDTFTATFVVTAPFFSEDKTVGTVEFEKGDKYVEEPEVEMYTNYTFAWDEYELNDEDVVIYGRYTPVESDEITEVESENKAEYKNGIAKITLEAKAGTKNIKILSKKTKPVDIVLVLDQSGSMAEQLSSDGTTKQQALINCANSFVNELYKNAVATGADHRIAVVGFAYSDYNNGKYVNTGILATTDGQSVNYSKLNDSVYAKALIPVVTSTGVNPYITKGINSVAASGATSANLGLEIAENIYIANPREENRERIILFITDGTPTSWGETTSLVQSVAESAIEKANLIKKEQGAKIYSIGVHADANPSAAFTTDEDGVVTDNRNNFQSFDFNRFLHAVSSNYPDASSMYVSEMGNGSKDNGFYMAVNDTENLNDIFTSILYSAVYVITTFDKVTLVDTISKEFTLTLEQEAEMRENLINSLGIKDEDITVVRNSDGTTTVMFENIRAKKIYNPDGSSYYSASVFFCVSADKDTLDGGKFAINTEDAGVEIDGERVYVFDIPTVNIPADRNIIVFTIDGVVYRIDEAKLGDKVEIPETDLAKWNVHSGTSVTGNYAMFEAGADDPGHTEGEWLISKEPTCDSNGTEEVRCVFCDEVIATRELEKITHTALKVEKFEATCNTEGSIAHYVCSMCGKLFSDEFCKNEITSEDIVVEKQGHTWSDWVEIKSPTVNEVGIESRECLLCREKENRDIPKREMSLILEKLKPLRGKASIKSYKGEEYIAITMTPGKTVTGIYKDMVDGGTVELVDICGNIQARANDYVAYQSQNKTNPVATMKVTYADGTVETYPVVVELYEIEREIPFNPTTKIKPIRGKVSLAEDAKGEYILVEMLEGQSSVGVYKASLDGTTATLDGAEGMFTEQEKLYIFYGSQNTFNSEGRLTVTEADGNIKTYRVLFKMYEMDPYVNVAKGLRPVRGAVTFDADGTIRIKMTSGQTSVGLYKTMANGATFRIVDANGRMTNNSSSVMFYMTNNKANVTATMIFTLPDGTTKEQKIIFDMGLASDPNPLESMTAVRGTISYQNDGTEDYIEVKANALSTGVGLYKDCLVKYTITDADGVMTENDSRYYIYKSQNLDGMTANINFLQSDGSYKTYKVKFVF